MDAERGANTYQEIMSQGQAWEQTLAAFDQQRGHLAAWLSQPREAAIFTGCGSTYYLSLAAASLWQSLTGRSASGIPASELWLFPEAALTLRPSLLVAVSRSGETSETLHALEAFRQHSTADILGVTVYAESQLARISPHVLVTAGAEEHSVAQTRSFSSMYVLIQAMTTVAAGNLPVLEHLKGLPGCFERLVHAYEPLAKSLADDLHRQHFVFLGSGAYYGLALEAMLKMKEMSLSAAEAFHFLEYRHGPKSLVSERTLVTGLISDASRREELKVLSEMRRLGARVLALDETRQGLEADDVVELDSGLSYLERGALMLPVLQLMAYYRSMANGLNPDMPTNLDAVVRLNG
jgi:glucosamine--fructose-6-phosphate aminotransferase (isomerizing)